MKKKTVSVIGLGYIGLPTACIIADSGFKVYGIEKDDNTIFNINNKKINYERNLIELLSKVIDNKSLIVSKQLQNSDIYIIAVPTPLKYNFKPDQSILNKAIDLILPYLKQGNLVIIESTCLIGTTEKIFHKINKIQEKVNVAYCPERVLPGNIIEELKTNNRVIGGVNSESTKQAIEFYKFFVSGDLHPTDSKTAEAVKLAENSYRDVNIAFANELSIIADYNDLDINKIINLANNHPRVDILKEGVGVGGHCIAVDPYYLASSAPYKSSLIIKARKINDFKTQWVINKIKHVIKLNNIKTVTFLGLTYKANVRDVRNSPAVKIINEIEKEVNVIVVDPNFNETNEIYGSIAQSDMVVGLVAHKEFFTISRFSLEGKVVLDFAEIFSWLKNNDIDNNE